MFGKNGEKLKKLVDENASNEDLAKAVVKEFGKESRLDVVTLDNEVSAYVATSKMLSDDLDNNGYLITAIYSKEIEDDKLVLYVVSLKGNAEKEEDDVDIPTIGELFVSLHNKWFEENDSKIDECLLCRSVGDYVRKGLSENKCECEDDENHKYSSRVTVLTGTSIKLVPALNSIIKEVKGFELVESFVKELEGGTVLCSLLLRTKKD